MAPEADLHLGAQLLRVRLGELALGDTAFPHLTLVRQADVEAVLAQAVAKRGIEVERGAELLTVHEDDAGVRAIVQCPTGTEAIRCDFLTGCDGQASMVRQMANIEWRGAPYAEEVILADVELDRELSADVAHGFVRRRGLLLVFRTG